MLLSVIGGNKDVANLVFMTSTNYIKKIDPAIARRLSGKFQVGGPNAKARGKIILAKVEYFKGRVDVLEHAIKITTNFTGAALVGFCNSLRKNLKLKEMNNIPAQLTIN